MKTLADRFRAVVNAYTPAVDHAGENPEYIHQLRVASRRMVAALRFFGPVLPAKNRDKLITTLQRLRKSAGDARDIDVLRQRIESGDIPLKQKSRKKMLRFLKRQRIKAQQPVIRMRRKLDGTTKLVSLFDAMCARFEKQDSEKRFDPLERRDRVIRKYRKRLSAEPASADALHRLRIDGKELRYTLELTRDCKPVEVVERILKRFRILQNRLGCIVDYEASRKRLKSWKKKSKRRQMRKLLTRVAKREHREWRRAKRRFHHWWTTTATGKLQSELRQALVSRPEADATTLGRDFFGLPESDSRP